ncbi:MAG: DUF4166 domain-containing protein [Planctomycetota bacterium]
MGDCVIGKALGERFERLHPTIREQYSINSESAHAWIGRGVMRRIWRGGPHVAPFIWIGSRRRILFVETGRDVPFTVTLIAYRDAAGRECITWLRAFDFGETHRRFDEVLAWSDRRHRTVVLCGTRQHLAVDIDLDADRTGALMLQTSGQRVYAWGARVPWPRLVSGDARVRAGVEQDGHLSIDGGIHNPLFGRIFGYEGIFELQRVPREEACDFAAWEPAHANRWE